MNLGWFLMFEPISDSQRTDLNCPFKTKPIVVRAEYLFLTVLELQNEQKARLKTA